MEDGATKPRRMPNFNKEEKAVLLEEMAREVHIIEDKRTENRINLKKKEAWERLRGKFRNRAGAHMRRSKQLQNA